MSCYKMVRVSLLCFAVIIEQPAFGFAPGDICPMLAKIPCPAMRLAKYDGDVVQLVHKFLPPDHQLAKRPEIASKETNLICDEPDCLSSPCMNGGTCAETLEGYLCSCPDYSYGMKCENINECASDPCMNGGFCSDAINMYVCACVDGYAGTDCATDIDECASNPCTNGGVCTEGVNLFSCSCPSGYHGVTCATVTTCPSGWIAGYGSKCYLFTDTTLTRYSAKLHCDGLAGLSVGGQTRYPSLLTMDSDAETTTFLALRTHSNSYWLNCDDQVTEGTFICKTTREGAVEAYRNWLENEPNDAGGNEDCTGMHVSGGGRWNDIDCDSMYEVACQLYKP